MEEKTNCKIAIRGRGSVKEGARGRKDGKAFEGEDEELHVLITGDNQSSVDAAADMVRQMLVVIDDDKNIHKQQQLRELALLNGTLKEEEFCSLCAEKGHKSYECPKRFSMTKKVSIKCTLCGDTSHITRDCMLNRNGNGQENDSKKMDSDYLNFMAELDGKKADSANVNTDAGDGGAKFCQAVNEKGVSSSSVSTGGSSLIMTISTRKVMAAEQSPFLNDNDYTYAELTEGNQPNATSNGLPSSSQAPPTAVPMVSSAGTLNPSQSIVVGSLPMTAVNNVANVPLGNAALPIPPPTAMPLPPPTFHPSTAISSVPHMNMFPSIPTVPPLVLPMAPPYGQYPHPQYTTAPTYYNPSNPYNPLITGS
jgi:splicing factor 1